YDYEEDFRKIFKVRVEFDEEMAMNDTVIAEYAGRLRALSEKENLWPFDRGAFAAILEYGVRMAGRRNKVTARFVDIADLAREANRSGRFHDKGMHIISGFLRSHFAQNKPLSLAASICFEQSYSGVDGDSASSTEVYALVSALANLPLRQDIAVTGSMNQQGD